MNVACLQFDIAWEDKRFNFQKVNRLVREAKLEPGALLLLPELFATGFSMNAREISEAGDGPTAQFVSELARSHGVHVLAGIAQNNAAARPENVAVLFNPAGEAVGRYAKAHPFTPAGEHENYVAGTGPVVWTVSGWRVQPSICYDLRFPELFRTQATAGAELICVIASWPSARAAHWTALLKARAIENQAYVAAVNRCGNDPHYPYPGLSQIINPLGEVIADAGEGEGMIQSMLEKTPLESYRSKLPFLKDVRSYDGLKKLS